MLQEYTVTRIKATDTGDVTLGHTEVFGTICAAEQAVKKLERFFKDIVLVIEERPATIRKGQ
jgi:hypothetical protein